MFYLKTFIFSLVKYSIYLNRRVFVMVFTTDRSKAVVFGGVCFLWLCGYSLWGSILFVVLLLCLVDPVLHCDIFIGREEPRCFDFLWSVACVLSVLIS